MTPPSARITLCYLGADGPWDALTRVGFRRRNTCLLRALSEHEDVARIYNITWVLRWAFLKRLVLRRSATATPKVTDVYVCTLFPERAWLPLTRWLNRRIYPVEIALQTGRWSFDDCVIWCYWPHGFRLASRLGLSGRWVFDADHNLLHDENRTAGFGRDLVDTLRAAASKCDVVVAASRSMLHWFGQNGARRTVRLRNGATVPGCGERLFVNGTGRAPRVGYLGVLSTWVDYELLRRIAASRSDWTFVVAGATHDSGPPGDVARLPNVQSIGEVKPDDVPGLLATFDVALGLYRSEPWLDGDSMKVFDYLAAGVPVVSTRYHDDLEDDFAGLIDLASTASEFVEKIQKVLARDGDASRAWDARRRRFIERNTWTDRAGEAVRSLQEELGHNTVGSGLFPSNGRT